MRRTIALVLATTLAACQDSPLAPKVRSVGAPELAKSASKQDAGVSVDAVTDLGTLAGTTLAGSPAVASKPLASLALSVSGQARYAAGWSELLTGGQHGFVYDIKRGTMTDIGTLGGVASVAWAVNDNGVAVGFSFDARGNGRGFVWSARTGMLDIGTLGGQESRANALDDDNPLDDPLLVDATDVAKDGIKNVIVVGWSLTAPGDQHAFMWTEKHGMLDLGTLGGRGSVAQGVNSKRQVVGWSHTPGGETHAFLWTQKTGMQDLGTLGGSFSQARRIDRRGYVAGVSTTAAGQLHAFVWTEDKGMTDLGVAGGAASVAMSTDGSAGDAAGYTLGPDGKSHAVVWSGKYQAYYNLDELAGGSVASLATGMAGNVVVGGRQSNGSSPMHAAIWVMRGL